MEPKINHNGDLTIRELSECLQDGKFLPACAFPVARSKTYRVHPNVAIRSYKITQSNWCTFTTSVLTPPDALVEVVKNDHIVSDRVVTESHVRRQSYFPRTLLPTTTFPAYYHGTNTQYTVGICELAETSGNEFGYPYGIHSSTRNSPWMTKDV